MATTSHYKDRQVRLSDEIKKREADAFLSSSGIDMIYLAGFSGEGLVFYLPDEKPYIITDGRYVEEAMRLKDIKLVQIKPGDGYIKTFCMLIDRPISILCGKDFSFRDAEYIRRHSPFRLIDGNDLMSQVIRRTKSKEEISILKKAGELSCEVFYKVKDLLKIGVTEKEIAAFINLEASKVGDGVSFDSIVAFGANSSLPHYKPQDVKLKEKDIVLIDMGIRFMGYCGDITRTFIFNGEDNLFSERYQLLSDAREKAIRSISEGVELSLPEKIVREHLGEEEKYFIHSLGHGLGLEIHEKPILTSVGEANRSKHFSEGDVFTVEPGLYYPGWGGIRIEDDFVIEEGIIKKITY
ncbi:Xaa-Pro peptidase family protein [Thermodesulfobium sp. 4217-1]|uniref:M24 family metallopeptidase n=1 Tax=Thermodesulfobium sp. 4217-1 TaxID=3120013 RepID=UPI0032213C74